MKKILFFIFSSTILIACDAKQPSVPVINVLNPDMAQAMGQYLKTFSRHRNQIEFNDGTIASNCTAYIKASRVSNIKQGVNNQLFKSEYLECDVLTLLGNYKFIQAKVNDPIGKDLATRLDLRSFPSSFNHRLDKSNYTLDKVAKAAIKVGPTDIRYETTDWFYRLETVAIADVNKNKKSDWIIWLVDESKVGTYRNYQTLIIYDVESTKGELKATPYPAKK